MRAPVYLKLGGSLITDKTRPETSRHDVIARLADEVRQALDTRPDLSLVLGHGSGSFGHWVGSQYGTRDGVSGRDAWIGYARVAASAARLNRIVTDKLLAAGVPVVGIPGPGIEDTIVDGLNGLHSPEDAEAFAAQMWRLASDVDLRGQLACGARESSDQYDIRYTSSALMSHYERLVEERVAAGRPS